MAHNLTVLPDLLREQLRSRPDSTAVVYEDETLSFRELAGGSAGLAAYLRHLGVVVDDCVGLFVDPSIELMVGAWGILCSGGAYLPLSPEYPEDRLRFMIENSGTRVIVTQEALRSRLTELAPPGTRIVTPHDAAEHAGQLGDDESGPRPDSLAYVIYTSGSTGRPKGVMIEHRGIVNQLRWLHATHALNHERVVVQKTPMSFDAAQWEILAPGCGATVVMGAPGVYRDPDRLIETIAAHGVTTLQCVPTLLQALLDTDELHSCRSLAQIFSGGEALSKNLALSCVEALPWCELVNLYGPTECTINSSAFVVDPDGVRDGPNPISIGAPVHDTEYHILDDHMAPVTVGEVGELYVGGVQLARGYLHRPDLTRDSFVDSAYGRLFRTGDLAYWNPGGTVQFVGRADNQVKLRGFRVELDEIRLGIEDHEWVKNAAVIVKNDPRTGFQNLIACVELNPKEAALMDQGNHGAHHQSKESKLQVKAQLSNPGRRNAEETRGKQTVDLPGRAPTEFQRRWVFARKTYRFFEGEQVRKADLLALLGRRIAAKGSRPVGELSYADFGEILRCFGQCISGERLLPKYAYASPGSLYATQLYVEIDEIGDLRPGFYYYHPGEHQLVLIREKAGTSTPAIAVHFVGKKRAIEPVYKTNIQEVLEIETGHMVGLFEEVLPGYGLGISDREYAPDTTDNLECSDEDYYLGSFDIVPYADVPSDPPAHSTDLYVQTTPGRIPDLPAGQYRYADGELHRISDELVGKKHVIAINQHVYDRSSFGITAVSRTGKDWRGYVDLGRTLQYLSMNELNLGFMPSGYSSRTGADLPAAKRMAAILDATGDGVGPSYFFVGGRVSDEQLRSRGMKEDVVHMKGPAEMIRDDLVSFLPDYMIPNKVVVLDRLPVTANGKIDVRALEASEETNADLTDRPFVAPRTNTERMISGIWKKVMKRDVVSVQDDFFQSGGNSLIAVRLVNLLNKELGSALPLQVLFEAPTVERLARTVDGVVSEPVSRLVRLRAEGTRSPVYCWPGLGGYTMNLRQLAGKVDLDQPVYGVQAYGINADESPYATIREMAAEDVAMIRRHQPEGPYTLWGYSFGARVAFESAYQLEQAGERVENLFLIAPGSPKVRTASEPAGGGEPGFGNEAYVRILFSVFAGTITGPLVAECLRAATDEESFTSFVCERLPELDRDLVRRIVRIVGLTFEFEYTFRELEQRRLETPITIFKAVGDDYSFIENRIGFSAKGPTVITLEADHYSLLREPGVGELVTQIQSLLRTEGRQEHYAA